MARHITSCLRHAAAAHLSVLLLSSLAWAHPTAGVASPSALPTPAVEARPISVPKDAAAPERALYLQLAAGAGLVGFDMNPELGFEDHSADGASVAVDVLVGVSPHRGAALGGALLLDLAPSMKLASRPSDDARSTLGMAIVGPFVDATPEPAWGLHLGLAAGFAVLSIHPNGEDRAPIYGLGGAAWAGNDFRIGPSWSVGGALRVSRTLSGNQGGEFDLEASCLATSLLLTAAHR
jgi:hypothetical protein